MNILRTAYSKIHTNLMSKSSVYSDTPGWSNYSGGGASYQNDAQELSAYEKIVWFAACVDAVAKDATSTGYHFVRTGTEEKLELSSINEDITRPIDAGFGKLDFSKIRELMMSHKKLTGNAYLFMAQTSAYGAIYRKTDQFYPLSPAAVKPRLSQDNLTLIDYEVTLGGGLRFNIPPDRMIQYIQNPIFNPNIGVGNVTKARLIAENETESDQYTKEFLVNRAAPSLVITDQTKRHINDIERLTDLLAKKYEKKKNAGKLLYMNGEGVNVQSLALTQKDMQFLEGKVFNRQAILTINQVPGVRLAIPDGANKAMAELLNRTYLANNINSEIKDDENTFNAQFVHTIDPNVSIVFPRHHTGDIDQIKKMIESAVITPNRGSQILGEEVTDSKERNTYYLSHSFLPIEMAGSRLSIGTEEPQPNQEPKPKPGKATKIDLTNPKNIDAILDHFEKSATSTKRFQKKFLQQALEDRNVVEDKYYPELSAFFKRSLDRILKNISENENLLKRADLSRKELVENDLLLIYNVNVDNADLAATAKRMHTSGVQRSVAGLNATMNESVNFSINNPFIKNAIGRLGKQIQRVNDSTKEAVEKVLLKEIENGGNVVTLTKALQDKFTDFQGYRARRIARTEARLAWDAGAEVMYRDVGVKTVDIVGCTEFEADSDCGKQDVSINLLSTLTFHPNHIGAPAPSIEPR